MCAIWGAVAEGLFADDNGFWDKGLVFGGYKHFFVQLFGIAVIFLWISVMTVIQWKFVLKGIIFRSKDLKVSVLDTYLGTKLFKHNTKLAFEELLSVNSKKSRQLLLGFHEYCANRFCDEQLDFLIAVRVFRDIYDELMEEKPIMPLYVDDETDQLGATLSTVVEVEAGDVDESTPMSPRVPTKMKKSPKIEKLASPTRRLFGKQRQSIRSAKKSASLLEHASVILGSNMSISVLFGRRITEQQRVIFHSMRSVINMYVRNTSERCVNVSDTTRRSLLRRFDRCLRDKKLPLDRDMFRECYKEVMQMMSDPCARFLGSYDRSHLVPWKHIRIPYQIDTTWEVVWDDEPLRQRRSTSEISRDSQIIISEDQRVGTYLREQMKMKAAERVHKERAPDRDLQLGDMVEMMQLAARELEESVGAAAAPIPPTEEGRLKVPLAGGVIGSPKSSDLREISAYAEDTQEMKDKMGDDTHAETVDVRTDPPTLQAWLSAEQSTMHESELWRTSTLTRTSTESREKEVTVSTTERVLAGDEHDFDSEFAL
jgi:hypothetical protein